MQPLIDAFVVIMVFKQYSNHNWNDLIGHLSHASVNDWSYLITIDKNDLD